MERLSSLEKEFGNKVKGYSVDLSDITNLECIKLMLSEEQHQVKYLVNNAGTGRMAPSTDFSAQEIEKPHQST